VEGGRLALALSCKDPFEPKQTNGSRSVVQQPRSSAAGPAAPKLSRRSSSPKAQPQVHRPIASGLAAEGQKHPSTRRPIPPDLTAEGQQHAASHPRAKSPRPRTPRPIAPEHPASRSKANSLFSFDLAPLSLMSFGLTSQLPHCPLPHAYPVAAACHAEEKRRSGEPAPALGSPPDFPTKQTFQKTGPSKKPELPAQPPVHQRGRLAHKALSPALSPGRNPSLSPARNPSGDPIRDPICDPGPCHLPTDWPANQLARLPGLRPNRPSNPLSTLSSDPIKLSSATSL
jgi:hypothetical protein